MGRMKEIKNERKTMAMVNEQGKVWNEKDVMWRSYLLLSLWGKRVLRGIVGYLF